MSQGNDVWWFDLLPTGMQWTVGQEFVGLHYTHCKLIITDWAWKLDCAYWGTKVAKLKQMFLDWQYSVWDWNYRNPGCFLLEHLWKTWSTQSFFICITTS